MESPERARWYGRSTAPPTSSTSTSGTGLCRRPGSWELIEGPSRLPPRRALDLGCGTGTETIYLARHGWDATGVDLCAALAIARRRAARAGVSPRFLTGDTTRLRESGIGADYDLLVDYGCYHTLPVDRRDAYADGVSEAAAGTPPSSFWASRTALSDAGRHPGGTRSATLRWLGLEVVQAERLAAAAIPPLKLRAQVVAARFGLWAYRLRRLGPDGSSAG